MPRIRSRRRGKRIVEKKTKEVASFSKTSMAADRSEKKLNLLWSGFRMIGQTAKRLDVSEIFNINNSSEASTLSNH
jgi:hypothetical protein